VAGCVCVKFDWCQFAVSGGGRGVWMWRDKWVVGWCWGTHQCQSICANSNEQRMMSGNLHQRLIEEATGG